MDEKMKVYKVKFEGFAYVYAENPEQAELLFDADTYAYSEQDIVGVEETPYDEEILMALED